MKYLSFLSELEYNIPSKIIQIPILLSRIENDKFIVSYEAFKEDLEGLKLGPPRERLMAILSKDTITA
jgi:hypothetical protein